MLKIEVVLEEGFDDATSEFVTLQSVTYTLEHSLISLSKWESKWELPFLEETTVKTDEMFMDYIEMMIVDDTDPEHLKHLSQTNVREIGEYINSKQSAAWFNDVGSRKGNQGKIVTSDLIYYWMVASTIPFEAESWHLNRLITLIRIAEAENQPKKKMPRRESMKNHRSQVLARQAQQRRDA